MRIVSHVRNFLIGVAIVFLTPSFLMLMLTALIAGVNPNPTPLGGGGPICELLERKETVSPNGRLVAISVRVVCEDENYEKLAAVNHVYVRATRMERAGHIFTTTRNTRGVAVVAWADNHKLIVEIADGEKSTYARPWCGVAAAPQESGSP